MKKISLIFLFLACAFAPYALDAQTKEDRFRAKFPYKYEFRIGFAGYPMADYSEYGKKCDYDTYVTNSPSLDDLYSRRRGTEYMTGIISGEFSVHFKRWFSLAVTAGFNGLWGNSCDPADGGVLKHYSGVVFTFLPEARFNWVNTGMMRLYSSAGLGISAGSFAGDYRIYPAFLVSPLGITLGRRVFCFAEYDLGTTVLGGRIGFGCRF